MPLPVQPHGSHVLLHRLAAESTSAGGIVIPEVSRERPTRGVVIAVGPGDRLPSGERLPISLAVGNEVLYARDKGTEISVNDVELTLVSADHIVGVLEHA